MCLSSVLEGVSDAVELGGGVLEADLFDNPPHGRTVRHMVMHASRHSRVQYGERVAVAREDKGSRITVVGKIARALAVVVYDDPPGLESEFGAGIALHARIATQGILGGVAVLADDVEGIAVLVHRVGIEDAEARKNGTDGELETGWDLSAIGNGIEGPEVVFELTGRVFVTWKS